MQNRSIYCQDPQLHPGSLQVSTLLFWLFLHLNVFAQFPCMYAHSFLQGSGEFIISCGLPHGHRVHRWRGGEFFVHGSRYLCQTGAKPVSDLAIVWRTVQGVVHRWIFRLHGLPLCLTLQTLCFVCGIVDPLADSYKTEEFLPLDFIIDL